jgi:hypothetical protein
MNSTEFVICDGTVAFSLDNQWMATMIAKERKGDFDTYFFVIDNFVKHANAKDTTDMLQWGLCSQVNYCQSDKKLLGCCLWRTTGNHGSSSWNI